VYYSGHGILDGETKIVINSDEFVERFFPIERQLRNVSLFVKNCYIVGLLDCCRQQVKMDAMRGVEEELGEKKEDFGVNFIMTWGCPPSSGVPAKSSIVTSYTDRIANKTKKGVVLFPECLIGYFGNDGKVETLPKCKAFLWLDVTSKAEAAVVKTAPKPVAAP